MWGDFFAKGGSADLDPNRDYAAMLRAPDSIIGSPVAFVIWAPLSQVWPQDNMPSELGEVHPTNVETLLVSGSIDFSTPAEYATKELLPSLKNGKQVILSEMGHVSDMWSVQPEATLRLITIFYDTGKTDDSLHKYEPSWIARHVKQPHERVLALACLLVDESKVRPSRTDRCAQHPAAQFGHVFQYTM